MSSPLPEIKHSFVPVLPGPFYTGIDKETIYLIYHKKEPNETDATHQWSFVYCDSMGLTWSYCVGAKPNGPNSPWRWHRVPFRVRREDLIFIWQVGDQGSLTSEKPLGLAFDACQSKAGQYRDPFQSTDEARVLLQNQQADARHWFDVLHWLHENHQFDHPILWTTWSYEPDDYRGLWEPVEMQASLAALSHHQKQLPQFSFFIAEDGVILPCEMVECTDFQWLDPYTL